MQHPFHHTPLILSKNFICQHIRKVKDSSNVRSGWFTHCNGLPHCMIANGVVFFLQGWIRSLIIFNKRHVITINIGRPSQWQAHHPKLVYDSTECLHSGLRCCKLSPKDGALNSWLLIIKPSNQRHIKIYQKNSSWASIRLVPCMVTINHHPKINLFPRQIKRIWRNFFGGITIKLLPVSTIIKGGLFN